jgi:hypothetical protein
VKSSVSTPPAPQGRTGAGCVQEHRDAAPRSGRLIIAFVGVSGDDAIATVEDDDGEDRLAAGGVCYRADQQASRSTIMTEAIDSSTGENVIWLQHLGTRKDSEIYNQAGQVNGARLPARCAVISADPDWVRRYSDGVGEASSFVLASLARIWSASGWSMSP